jgi:hypothetical protein
MSTVSISPRRALVVVITTAAIAALAIGLRCRSTPLRGEPPGSYLERLSLRSEDHIDGAGRPVARARHATLSNRD